MVFALVAPLLFACGGKATDSDSKDTGSGGTSNGAGGEFASTGGVTGSGGAPSGGASTGGWSSADGGASTVTGGVTGSGGESATGGAAPIRCEWDGKIHGKEASTNPDPADPSCDACLKEQCKYEYAACFATNPDSTCGYFPDFLSEGMFVETYLCLLAAFKRGEFTGSQADVDACLALHAGGPCTDHATTVTRALTQCMAGLPTPDTFPNSVPNCLAECSLL